MAGVRVKGLREFTRGLEKLGVAVADLKDVMSKLAQPVVQDAKSLTPVRSGRLQASIRSSKAKNKAVIRGGTKTVNYASFVEFGSVHNDEVGMVTGAIEANETSTAEGLDRELQALVRRYGLH